MRRALKWLGWTLAVLLLLPVLLVAGLLGALNTGAGQRAAAQAVGRLTGGGVQLEGLAGRFPDALRVERVELRDPAGAWLTLRGVVLDWQPARLFDGEAHVTQLTADSITVARMPPSSAPAPAASSGPAIPALPKLPVRVVIDALRVARVEVAAAVAGQPAALAVEASGRVDTQRTGAADFLLRPLDGRGDYRLHAVVSDANVTANLVAEEPAHGFLSVFASLPDLGALSLHASLDGPWSGIATHLDLAAGPLRAGVQGQVNVAGQAADLDVTASAPAMTPRPDLSWHSVAVEAHVHGAWTAPRAQGSVVVEGLSAAGGAGLAKLSVKLAGDLGKLTAEATAEQLRIPGPAPDLVAATPVTLKAEALLDDKALPVTFALSHPLLSLTGQGHLAGAVSAKARLELPDLAAFAPLGLPPLAGHAGFDIAAALPGTLHVEGDLALTDGPKPAPALLGPSAHIAADAALHGSTVVLEGLHLAGAALSLDAHGSFAEALDVGFTAALPNLSILAPQAQGALTVRGTVRGTDLAVDADGIVQGAPLVLSATAVQGADGTLHLGIGKGEWKSLHAEGALTLAKGADLPAGRIALKLDRLADLAPLLGQPLAGAATAELATDGPSLRLRATARALAVAGTASVGSATADVRVRDPMAAREIEGSLDLSGLSASGVTGTARLEAKGTPAALALTLRTSLAGVGDSPLQANASARIDATAKAATLSALQADWHGETLRLLAPARLAFAPAVSVDRIRLGLRDAVLEIGGKFSPALDVTATLRNLPAELVAVVAPDLHPLGSLQADARLTGAPARPDGRLHLAAIGLRLRSGPGSTLPPATVTADATLAGGRAQLSAKAAAGRNEFSVTGTAPLDPAGAMDLRATGGVDLAVLDPVLAPAGRRARGQVTVDATLTGTPTQPRAGGTMKLADASVEDIPQGIHIAHIDGRLEGTGDTLRLVSLTGHAGPGTISGSGTIGLTGAMPVDITVTGKKARPIASDPMTVDTDIDLKLQGELEGQLTLGGTVTIDRAEIRVPEQLPAKVAVLNIRRPRQPPPPPVAAGPDIALNIVLRAPGQVFVRGRGLDAELQGRITVGGDASKPHVTGRFQLRHGTFNLGGQTLTFSSGEIGFEGNPFDPTLNLVASSSNSSITATLTVGGTASAPKITLSSVPELPQDEVLAQLLFHQSASSLSPIQLASIAAALAQVSGVGGGFDPLARLRQGLGLDRLSVGGSSTGSGATVEGGRYVAPNIFVGARQTSGGSGGTQAIVQYDLTRQLKLQAIAGTGGTQSATGASTTDDPGGSSVGITYQFEY